jgi:hypothetical protein
MKSILAIIVCTTIAVTGFALAEEPAQSWQVKGRVASFSFNLDCDFRKDGTRVGGVCGDASTSDPTIKSGRSHTLTSGRVSGDKISWTYQSSFLLSKFDVTFDGIQRGDRMAGVIHVRGHDGTFTATRR